MSMLRLRPRSVRLIERRLQAEGFVEASPKSSQVNLKPISAFLLLFLAASGSTTGQTVFSDLTTTSNGGTAYFTSTLVRGQSGESAPLGWAPGRIYRIDAEGLKLYLERPRIDPPPTTDRGISFTNYFDLFRPQASRDGSVAAITGHRICSGSSSCASYATLQTTVTGLPGGAVDIAGAGRLSGNGRYLMIYADGSLRENCVYVVDLQTGQDAPPEKCARAEFNNLGAGRTVADDGTAVSASSFGSLSLIRGPAVTEVKVASGRPGEAVIDSGARVMVYSSFVFDGGSPQRSIRIYRISEQRDSALAEFPNADSHTPYISADGRRVMFLSNASGLTQIYTVETNGGAPRQVSHDSTGVLSATMSDDGKVAWYFSGAARLYQMNLDSGETQERLGRTPQIQQPIHLVAGSLKSIVGSGFSDRTYAAESYPLPRSLGGVAVSVNGVDSPLVSVSPTEIVLQVPSQAGPEMSVEVKAESTSSFVPQLRFSTAILTGWGAFLYNPQSPSAYGLFDALAIHQDWSGLVTARNPAWPGEIVSLYGTGFGPVTAPPADGLPAPADPPARTVRSVTCTAFGADNARLDIPVLYAGLAPGLAGVYQMDVRVPLVNLRGSLQIHCIGEGDNSDFYGSFAVGVQR